MLGVATLGECSIPVVQAATVLGEDSRPAARPMALVCGTDDREVAGALIVDEVLGVETFPGTALSDPPPMGHAATDGLLRAVVRGEERLVMLVEPADLLLHAGVRLNGAAPPTAQVVRL